MTTLDKTIAVFITFIVGIVFGYLWRMDHEDYLWNRQLEVQLKKELADTRNQVFRIPETNIVITKLADHSGIIRIKENK